MIGRLAALMMAAAILLTLAWLSYGHVRPV
jgi:hypothetical protein